MDCTDDSCKPLNKMSVQELKKLLQSHNVDFSLCVEKNELLALAQQRTVSDGVVKVAIYSDTMCPWCFVGKRNFERAAQSFPQVRFEVEWHPFLLNTSIPKEGIALSDYFRKNHGRAINVNDIFQHLKAAGQRCGIDFKPTEKVFPTIDSHRLIEYSKQKKKHEEVGV
eukprot:TRINITY_DN3928_c0_g1_i16.p1 TRINITY_DN3928_c0_g1~~TRINITY_DN3928_c0_g1_i16.p1  ORF type:complete len:168 (-),score=31.39 TRINITY_DN3928_c0_g1_i16:576-1079(-)